MVDSEIERAFSGVQSTFDLVLMIRLMKEAQGKAVDDHNTKSKKKKRKR